MIVDEQHDLQKVKESVYILERGLLKKTDNLIVCEVST